MVEIVENASGFFEVRPSVEYSWDANEFDEGQELFQREYRTWLNARRAVVDNNYMINNAG
jgi:hypothetical protein